MFHYALESYGERIFDCEEVGIETKDLSFNDYLYIRTLALFVETLHNGRPFDELFSYAEKFGISRTKIIKSLQDNILDAPNKVHNLYKQFINETKDELWDSEEELLNHYHEEKNYLKLKKGLVGGNLIYKYKALNIVLLFFI